MPDKLRVVLDTNVLVSGFINPNGPPGKILKALRKGEFIFLTSPEINEEVLEVMNRPRLRDKFGLKNHIFDAAYLLWETAQVMPNPPKVKVSRDPDDDKFLAAAVEGSAHYLVTGDINDLLILGKYKDTRIVTPFHFLEAIS